MRKSTKIISLAGILCFIWLTIELWPKNNENYPQDTSPTSEISAPEPPPTNTFEIKKITSSATTTTAIKNPAKTFATLIINQTQFPIYTSTNTLYQILQNLKSTNELNFKTHTYPGMGEFVTEINGVANDKISGKYWIYYINNTSAQIGVSQYIPKQNDIIEWKYETQKF